MRYDPTIYQGAAAYYRAGRPPYSGQLEAVLVEELGLDGTGTLLDVGCGPGSLTVRLAGMFEEAIGLDPDPAMLDEARAWGRERESYLGSARRAGRGVAPVRADRFEDVLARSRFGAARSVFAPGVPDLVRTSESVLAGYFSMSFSAPHLFGQRVEDFAAEVRQLLASRSADGLFRDWPGDTEIVLARKPG